LRRSLGTVLEMSDYSDLFGLRLREISLGPATLSLPGGPEEDAMWWTLGILAVLSVIGALVTCLVQGWSLGLMLPLALGIWVVVVSAVDLSVRMGPRI